MTKSLFVRPMLARTAMVVMAATLDSGCAGLGLDGFGTSGLVASTAPIETTASAASGIAPTPKAGARQTTDDVPNAP